MDNTLEGQPSPAPGLEQNGRVLYIQHEQPQLSGNAKELPKNQLLCGGSLAPLGTNGVLVVDRKERNLRRVDWSGHQGEVWSPPPTDDGYTPSPSDMARDEKNKTLFIADPKLRAMVAVDEDSHKAKFWFGQRCDYGGVFVGQPFRMDLDCRGYLHVLDKRTRTISYYTGQGKLLQNHYFVPDEKDGFRMLDVACSPVSDLLALLVHINGDPYLVTINLVPIEKDDQFVGYRHEKWGECRVPLNSQRVCASYYGTFMILVLGSEGGEDGEQQPTRVLEINPVRPDVIKVLTTLEDVRLKKIHDLALPLPDKLVLVGENPDNENLTTCFVTLPG
jgi:hypothetical protein